jgi:FAD/FMN-containing dehydrogenase
MTIGAESRSAAAEAAAALVPLLDPARVVTAEQTPDAAALWNGAVQHRPALVVRCETTADVQLAVHAARDFGLPLSVRGGGHDWAGSAVRPGGLVVDLTRMRQVAVDGRVATVGGGSTLADVAEAIDPSGLAAVTGTVGTVGMLGLALGGGYGPLNGRFGLAADNLLAAEVVLADGRVVRTDRDADPDLLWALRGGGGNFGVVTSADFAVHPVPTLLAGSILFPWEQAAQVLLGYTELAGRAPDELTAGITLVVGPDGTPAVAVSPTWAGAGADGRAVLEEFLRLGSPLMSDVAEMSPLRKLRQFDGAFPGGAQYAIRTRSVGAFTPDAAATLLEVYAARPGPGAFVNVHHFHGAAARVPEDATAFGLRSDHFMLELIETSPAGGPAPGDWSRTAGTLLAPHALPGGYPNLLGPDDVRQAAHAYGRNAARLLDVKARVDPEGVFVAIPLPPMPDRDLSAGSGEPGR